MFIKLEVQYLRVPSAQCLKSSAELTEGIVAASSNKASNASDIWRWLDVSFPLNVLCLFQHL